MYIEKRLRNSLATIKRGTSILLFVFIVLECILYPSPENLFGCLALLYGWLLISMTVLRQKYIARYYIAFIALFCYAFSFFVLPIPATLLEGKPVTFRFAVPYLTFFNLMLNATTIVLAFHACRFIYREGWLTALWKKMGFFRPPKDSQVWALGILGFLAMLWTVGKQGTDDMQAENLGAVGQFLATFRSFAFVPITLLFAKYYDHNRVTPVNKMPVFIYLVLLGLVAIATTKRTLLFNMVCVWAVMSFFIALYENRRMFNTKTTFYIIVGTYLVTGPIADLAIAMAINRQKIYTASSSSTFSDIMKIYSDKERLHHLYQVGTYSNTDNQGDNFGMWSEYYIDNIFLDRFCNLRTQDITLDYAQSLGYGSERMRDYAEKFFLFQLPTPVLNTLGVHEDKFSYNYTPGDLLSTDALKLRGQYGGFRVCGDSAVGLAWLGYPYYIVAFFIYILLFYFFASLVSFRKGILMIPVPVIMQMTLYMNYFNNATGIFRTIALLMRGGVQLIIIYCVIMWILRRILKN